MSVDVVWATQASWRCLLEWTEVVMGLEFVTERRLLTEDEVGFSYQDRG